MRKPYFWIFSCLRVFIVLRLYFVFPTSHLFVSKNMVQWNNGKRPRRRIKNQKVCEKEGKERSEEPVQKQEHEQEQEQDERSTNDHTSTWKRQKTENKCTILHFTCSMYKVQTTKLYQAECECGFGLGFWMRTLKSTWPSSTKIEKEREKKKTRTRRTRRIRQKRCNGHEMERKKEKILDKIDRFFSISIFSHHLNSLSLFLSLSLSLLTIAILISNPNPNPTPNSNSASVSYSYSYAYSYVFPTFVYTQFW